MRAALGFRQHLKNLLGRGPLNRKQRRAHEQRRSLVRRSRFDTLEQRVVLNADPIAEDDVSLIWSYYQGATQFMDYDLLSNDGDPDSDPLTISSIDTTSTQGTVNFDPLTGEFDYEAPTSFYGTDSFDYVVSDGNGGFDTATVYIDVLAPIAPIVSIANYWIAEDGHTLHVVFEVTDPDSSSFTFSYDNGAATDGTVTPLTSTTEEWVGELSELITCTVDDGVTDPGSADVVITFTLAERFGLNTYGSANILDALDVSLNYVSISDQVDKTYYTETVLNYGSVNGTASVSGGGQISFSPTAPDYTSDPIIDEFAVEFLSNVPEWAGFGVTVVDVYLDATPPGEFGEEDDKAEKKRTMSATVVAAVATASPRPMKLREISSSAMASRTTSS